MREIHEALVRCLAEETGVRTVKNRSKAAEYPLLAVSMAEEAATLVDGGRQVERQFALTVTARADRLGEGDGELLSAAECALLRGVPLHVGGEARVLHPMNCRTEGGELHCTLTVCLPVAGKQGEQAVSPMTELYFEL